MKKSRRRTIAEYLAYCRTTKLYENDFEKMLVQVEEENGLYKEAIEASYQLKCLPNRRRRKIEESHQNFCNLVKQIIIKFDEEYKKIKEGIEKISPNYKKGEREQNLKEFRRFCEDFANTYGDWFWYIRFKNDPFDDGNHGSYSIRELQALESNAWYSGGDWNKFFWEDIPYGGRLYKLNCPYRDFALIALLEQGKYKDFPPKKLRDAIE